jgi:ABC-type nitrate/sulfonate/bicarbonate transport system ATPase subunit
LMDQPFGALDAITRKMLNFEILKLWRETGKTFLMITNDIDEALLLSSKIYLMSDAPGAIINAITVDIPYDLRDQHIIANDRYNKLRGQLRALIKNTPARSGK